MSALSLAIGLVLLALVVAVTLTARNIAAEAATQIEAVSRGTITTTVRISQTVPIRASVPVNQAFEVPFNQQLPIDTVIKLQRELPVIGLVNFDLPIKTTIPVNVKVPVTINQNLPIDTSVLVQLDVPVTVSLAGSPLSAQLNAIAATLRRFAGR